MSWNRNSSPVKFTIVKIPQEPNRHINTLWLCVMYLIIHAAVRPASRGTRLVAARCRSRCPDDVCAESRLLAFCSDLRWGKAWNHSAWQPHLALLSLSCCPPLCSCKQTPLKAQREGRLMRAVMIITLLLVINEMENRQVTRSGAVKPLLPLAFFFSFPDFILLVAGNWINSRCNQAIFLFSRFALWIIYNHCVIGSKGLQ